MEKPSHEEAFLRILQQRLARRCVAGSRQKKDSATGLSRGYVEDMGILRAIICIFLPPLAVIDKGCGAILLVVLLTIAGWVPGVLAAIFICYKDRANNEW